jgi:c-di-GMP-binding flagellar brake protein YcgR
VKEIDNSLELQKLIQEQNASGGEHTIWVSNKENIRVYSFTIKNIDLVNRSLSLKIPYQEEEENSLALLEGVEVKVFLSGVNLTFFSEILTYKSHEGLLKITFPEIGYFKERRTEERKRPLGTVKIKFPIKGELSKGLIKDVLDLSSGGVSFILRKNDKFPFIEGHNLTEHFSILIEGKEIQLTGKVVKILKIKPFVLENVPYGDRLVSLAFTTDDEVSLKRWHQFWDSLQKNKAD